MNGEGAILGKAGEYAEEKSLGAIMINVWADYLEIGKEVLKQKDMTYVFINTATSRIFARKIKNYVLLIKSNKDVELGMLRAKSDILNSLLEDQVAKLDDSAKKAEPIAA